MGGAILFAIGALFAFGALGIAVGLPISLLVVGLLALTLLVRRDWVPVVYNLRSLTVRKVSTSLTALGLALVVFVFTTVLMLGSGINRTLRSTGQADNAKVLRKGAQSEVQSGVQTEQVRLLSGAAEVALAPDGQPLLSPEIVVLIFAPRENAKSEQDGTNVVVRGVGAKAMAVHSQVKIDGRSFQPGTSEILIGRALVGRFQGMRPGGVVHFARRDWNVVGVIDSDGSGFDSEVWGDADQFADAFQRRGGFSSVAMRLKDPSMVDALEARLTADPQLVQLEASREIEFYAAQSKRFADFIRSLGLFVAIIFALGAALGAMITMYAQVAARTREIGTLRAIGFRRRAVLVSFLVESLLLGIVSGVIGLAAASLWTFTSFSTMNFQSFSELSFRFVLTPTIAGGSIAFAAVMGYAGGILPAMRAARMPIVQATRGG
jgi:ABC-type lipoprotein release transport system permease subunit